MSEEKAAEKDPEVEKMSFEEAMKALEDIVRKLESGEMDLDESLKAYERAVVLRERCKAILDESDRKVQKIMSSGRVEDMPDQRSLRP